MILAHYYALVGGAVLLTAAWLFKAPERTAETSLGGFLAWGLVALLGDDVETYATAEAALTTANNSTYVVPQGEQLVAVAVPTPIRLFATLWALLSGLALLLYVTGNYPPNDERPVDKTGVDDT